MAFWFAYIVTRPLGASFADWLAVSSQRGGLAIGTGLVSFVLAATIAMFVAYLTSTGVDTPEEVRESRLPRPAKIRPVSHGGLGPRNETRNWRQRKRSEVRAFATVLSAASLALCVQDLPAVSAAPPPHPKPKRPTPALPAARPIFSAKRADFAMHRYFGAAPGLFKELMKQRGTAPYAYAWSFSQALAADLAVTQTSGSRVGLARVHRDLAGLAHYWAGSASPPGYDCVVVPNLGHGGVRFYDDNVWIGLDLVRAYRLIGAPALLRRAEEVFAFTKSGWDTNSSDPFPGGVFWTQSQANRDRNTISTAGAAKLGLELYLIDRQQAKLTTARSMLAWVDATLRAPNGLYWDHVSLDGRINKSEWSYNQGMMLGAYLQLYRATGAHTALHKAKAIARASLRSFQADPFATRRSSSTRSTSRIWLNLTRWRQIDLMPMRRGPSSVYSTPKFSVARG